jgi:AraC family transcriptional regulator of adaptative response/methylated-DNA-[protein]-cysteine methyltransferase
MEVRMHADYSRVAKAIAYLEQNLTCQPNLSELSAELRVSPFHLQRTFRRMAGISPKRFLQFLTLESGKRLLEQPRSVLDTAYELGLSGSARLHDHFVTLEGVTPGEFKARGGGLEIRWGIHSSVFGRVFIAKTERGICRVSFLGSASGDSERAELRSSWPGATITRDVAATESIASELFVSGAPTDEPIQLFVPGSNLQIQVWRALLRIPSDALWSYQQVAQAAGVPTAWRAVGNAIAKNPVAYLIPCHRVIRKTGEFGAFRWGPARKRTLIAWDLSSSAGSS